MTFNNLYLNTTRTIDLKPSDAPAKKGNILSSLMDDNFLKKINPRRYIYYKKYVNSLNNKEAIQKFMYTLKKITENKNTTDKVYKKIVKLTDELARIDTDTENYNLVKKEKLKELSDRVHKILQLNTKKYETDNSSNKNELLEEITSSFINNGQKGGNIIVDDSNDYLDKYSRKIEKILDNKKDKENTKLAKYKDILNEIDNVVDPINSLSITKEDRILFIVITFIVRILSITIINWGINNNYINSFENGIILYSIIYLLLIFIILMLVNIKYKYSINDIIYGNTGFSLFANSLYYFYLIPGGSLKRNGRIFIHSLFLIIFSSIPFMLKSNDNNKIDYDFVKKQKVLNLINKYTFVVWIFTSIITINY